MQGKLAYLDIALPQRGSKGLLELIRSAFTILTNKSIHLPAFSVTSTLPSIMNGGKDFCSWSKQDEWLYATMRKPAETVLGRDGIGLADCALCESRFEKDCDVSTRMLTLMSRLGEIQRSGTPDMEFAVVGLLARLQVSQGKAAAALDTVCDHRFIQPVAQYGAAVLPLLTTCGWKGDTAYLEPVILATREQTVNYPLFLRCESQLAELLSPTETQVLKLLCHNMSNGEIGTILGIKLATAKTHVSHIL